MIYIVTSPIWLCPVLLLLFGAWAKTGWKAIALPALVIDVWLNYTTSVLLWGFPHADEWTISKRLARQRHEYKSAAWLADLLNRIKPGHVKP